MSGSCAGTMRMNLGHGRWLGAISITPRDAAHFRDIETGNDQQFLTGCLNIGATLGRYNESASVPAIAVAGVSTRCRRFFLAMARPEVK